MQDEHALIWRAMLETIDIDLTGGSSIREVAVLATMVEGSLAYERDDATPLAP